MSRQRPRHQRCHRLKASSIQIQAMPTLPTATDTLCTHIRSYTYNTEPTPSHAVYTVHRNIDHPCHRYIQYKANAPATPPGLLNHTFPSRAAHTYIEPSRRSPQKSAGPSHHHRHSSNAGVHPVLRPGDSPTRRTLNLVLRSVVMLCYAGGCVRCVCEILASLCAACPRTHPFLRALVLGGMRERALPVRIGRSGVLLRFLMDLDAWVFAFEKAGGGGGGGRRGEATIALLGNSHEGRGVVRYC